MNRVLRPAVLALLLAFFPATVTTGAARDLARARSDAAKAAFDAFKAAHAAGTGALDPVYLWSLRWLAAEQEAGVAKTKALADHLARMTALAAAVKAKEQSGLAPRTDALAAAYYRLEAELWSSRK
jgi:hypothetical protein